MRYPFNLEKSQKKDVKIPIPDPLQKVSLISYRNLLRNTPKNLDLNLRN